MSNEDQTNLQRFNFKQIDEHIFPIIRKTGSKNFGDQISDYVELVRRLGDYRLTYVQANELNIYARGGISGVKSHFSHLKQSTHNINSPSNYLL